MRRTSGCKGASASSTNACGGFCFKRAGRAMSSTGTIADLPNAEGGRSLLRSTARMPGGCSTLLWVFCSTDVARCPILRALCEKWESTNPNRPSRREPRPSGLGKSSQQSGPSGPVSHAMLMNCHPENPRVWGPVDDASRPWGKRGEGSASRAASIRTNMGARGLRETWESTNLNRMQVNRTDTHSLNASNNPGNTRKTKPHRRNVAIRQPPVRHLSTNHQ